MPCGWLGHFYRVPVHQTWAVAPITFMVTVIGTAISVSLAAMLGFASVVYSPHRHSMLRRSPSTKWGLVFAASIIALAPVSILFARCRGVSSAVHSWQPPGGDGLADEVLRASDDLAAVSLAVIAAGQAASGAFLAGPTFSQYGYSWFRDGSFIAEALDLAGAHERSARFHHWVARIVTASAEGLDRARVTARSGSVPNEADYLHCRYTTDGVTVDGDWPTFQLDGPGIWLWGLGRHVELGGSLDEELSSAAATTARYLADLWPIPCADAWEEFTDQVHTSTLAAIAAGLKAASSMRTELAADESVLRARVALDARLSAGTGALTKWPTNPEVDASLLWLAAPYEYLSPEHPRFAATLARIEAELVSDGVGVHRYRSDTFYGGGAWPVLSSAYGRVLLRRDGPGDIDHARRILAWIEEQADETGAIPEQVAEHALAPDRVDEWRGLWGESAKPLLWSHAAFLALRIELEQHQARAARGR